MARIAKPVPNQLNPQFDKVEELRQQIEGLNHTLNAVAYQVSQLDYSHGKPTTNDLTFTWTGSTHTISWNNGNIRDKNAGQTVLFRKLSSAKGAGGLGIHTYLIPAGNTNAVAASNYYWIGWNDQAQVMVFTQDASTLYQNDRTHVICRIFTGTSGQSGTAGGGGSLAGIASDLSGLTYKNF